MGLTLQIPTKTYCCNDNKDRNIFNEDLDSDNEDNKEEDEKTNYSKYCIFSYRY